MDGYRLQVLVSDNSDNDATQSLCADRYSDVRYTRRSPGTTAADHFRAVIREAEGDFLVLLHDDDRLKPDYVQRLVAAFREHHDAVAISCNADIIDDAGALTGRSFNQQDATRRFTSARELLLQYLPGGLGCAPFPAYMYRREVLEPSAVDPSKGGKHFDAALVAGLTRAGAVIWLPDRLFEYRIHSNNDSKSFVLRDHLQLCRYMVTEGVERRLPALIEFRRRAIFTAYLALYAGTSWCPPIVPSGWRDRVVHHAILDTLHGRWFSRLKFRLIVGAVLGLRHEQRQ